MRIENELNKVVGFLYAKMPNEELVVTLDQEVGTTFCRNVKSHTQCGNSRICLSFRFYVKSSLDNLEVLVLPF